MSEENGSSSRIKVVDRRWFTEGGELREDRPASPPGAGAVAPPKPQPSAEPKPEPTAAPANGEVARAAEEGAAGARGTSQLFLELVATLAQQAELLMVGGQGFPRQPEQARRLIDYLGILESKTRGNLSPEEKQLLANAIFQLRTLYLQGAR